MTSTEPPPTWGDVTRALGAMSIEQRAAVWPELVQSLKLMRYAPSMVGLVDPPTGKQPHGLFRSHLDLPLLNGEQAHRASPAFVAVYELVREHQHCDCDSTVMAWRGAYAAIAALLAAPPKDGPFSEPHVADLPDGVWWGWRCGLPHGDHTAGIVRQSKGWNERDARKAYSAHMSAKHPEAVRP